MPYQFQEVAETNYQPWSVEDVKKKIKYSIQTLNFYENYPKKRFFFKQKLIVKLRERFLMHVGGLKFQKWQNIFLLNLDSKFNKNLTQFLSLQQKISVKTGFSYFLFDLGTPLWELFSFSMLRILPNRVSLHDVNFNCYRFGNQYQT